jgi:hypothetical protein
MNKRFQLHSNPYDVLHQLQEVNSLDVHYLYSDMSGSIKGKHEDLALAQYCNLLLCLFGYLMAPQHFKTIGVAMHIWLKQEQHSYAN